MRQFIDMIANFLKMGIDAIFNFIEFVWGWSFGNIVTIFQTNWQSLPIWKIALLAIVTAVIAFAVYKAILQLWVAAAQILHAFISLLRVLVSILPHILIAGAIAAAGSYVIQNINI